MRIISMDNARYFMTFIDGFSRKLWFYTLKSREKYFERFKELRCL
jgi:hypothetical protein